MAGHYSTPDVRRLRARAHMILFYDVCFGKEPAKRSHSWCNGKKDCAEAKRSGDSAQLELQLDRGEISAGWVVIRACTCGVSVLEGTFPSSAPMRAVGWSVNHRHAAPLQPKRPYSSPSDRLGVRAFSER